MTPDDTPHRARRRVRACSAALSSRFHVHIDKRFFAHNGKDETTGSGDSWSNWCMAAGRRRNWPWVS